ncbi:MAG TPA: EutN/CcmL family microcompartment protein [Kiritimatiellia bacterium]|nr:EutN/CcmL family microcompartment protein [Kiritimatiellia bacterium]HRZ13617.1 EutN/CcmL family microcompartment protein [Kiritimatiellia bacterium]HSA19287.1 EutN/CcmL family microcompartment protein [Kiritimatiellia bacterium]
MIIGRVIGEIHATIQHPFYAGKKLMVVEKISPEGKPLEDYVVAVDSVGAGPGERVLIVDEGNSARQIVHSTTAPLRSIIVGIIDEITTAN